MNWIERSIEAIWHATDLQDYTDSSSFILVSVHDHAINLQVASWKHLLIIADPFLEKGPATICLKSDDFALFRAHLAEISGGSFNPGQLELKSRNMTLRLDWRECRPVSFTPIHYENFDRKSTDNALLEYRSLLSKKPIPTAAAVLLGLPGGEAFFRQQINKYIPVLIKAILIGNWQEFLVNCRNIIGMGRGLTPTGDDLIHGALVAFHYFAYSAKFTRQVGNELSKLTAGTNIFGRHMLELGMKGLTPLAMIYFLETIVEGRPSSETLERVVAIGSCSGYDLVISAIYFARAVDTKQG